jgi:hypothetical protein
VRGGLIRAFGGLPLMSVEEEMSVRQHCCERMEEGLKLDCTEHEDVFECADSLVYYSDRSIEYGLIVHDGGSSYIVIGYCPWCGSKLPESKSGG